MADPANPQENQPSTVTPADSAGNVSVAVRNQPCTPLLPCIPVCCHAALPGFDVTGLEVAYEAGDDWGSPYIHPCCWPTAPVATAFGGGLMLLPTEYRSVPVVEYGSVEDTPPGAGTMLITVEDPAAAFRSEVGWTPPDSGWSSIGHHQPGLSWRISPR